MSDALTDRQREYREVYLRSEHWREVRRAALIRAVYRCQVCNGMDGLNVHHRTYERVGFERDADLTVLCRTCHDLFHSHGRLVDYDPAHLAPVDYEPEPIVQTAWGIVPEQFAGAEIERIRILKVLDSRGELRPPQIATATSYEARLVRGTLYVLRNEGLVRKGSKRRWSITDAGRLSLLGPGAEVGAHAGVRDANRNREPVRSG